MLLRLRSRDGLERIEVRHGRFRPPACRAECAIFVRVATAALARLQHARVEDSARAAPTMPTVYRASAIHTAPTAFVYTPHRNQRPLPSGPARPLAHRHSRTGPSS